MSPGRREHGFALVIVLWTLGLLALLGAAVTATGRQEARLATALRNADAARNAAEAALNQTCFELLAGRILADGVPHVLPVGTFRAVVVARTENGKVNPNTAPVELLATLLRLSGASAPDAAQVAAAIVAWRQATRDGGPDEKVLAGYRAAGLHFGPAGQPFRDIGELRLVLGLTPALFRAVAPHMSVFPTVLDPVAADPVVRQALQLGGAGIDPAAGGTGADGKQVTSISVVVRTPNSGAARIDAVVLLNPTATARPAAILSWDEA